MMKAAALRAIDKEKDLHLLAFAIERIKARKKVGKELRPVYRNFKEFYDHEKMCKEIMGTEPTLQKKQLMSVIAQANKSEG